MRRWGMWGSVLGWALQAMAVSTALAGDGAEEPPHPALVEMGQELFVQYCASCHGSGARGDGPAAGALKTQPADLTRIAARRGGSFPAGEIARKIDGRFAPEAHGTREMPVWGSTFTSQIPDAGVSEEVSRGRIAVLVEYLKTIQVED
jgi:mono/diheme cytochrome c family protein